MPARAAASGGAAQRATDEATALSFDEKGNLVLNGDGMPVIITKDPFTAGVYVPATTPRTGATTALRRARSR